MHEIIPLQQQPLDGAAVSTVNARDLHAFLEVRRDFNTWIKQRIAKYGFVENQDYVCFDDLRSPGFGTTSQEGVFPKSGENPLGGRPSKEYHLALDMAKELSMVQNNERGRQARQYFIACAGIPSAP
jgi:phage anti-repressor protein